MCATMKRGYVTAFWLLTGCYTSSGLVVDASIDGPPSPAVRRVCVDETECMPGEGCRLFPNTGTDRVCALPCTEWDSLCENGQRCFGIRNAACYPGVDPANVPTQCRSMLDCPAGFGCSSAGEAPGVCDDTYCNANDDCESGFACATDMHTCTPICHPLDSWTCPEGTLCMGGRCREHDLAGLDAAHPAGAVLPAGVRRQVPDRREAAVGRVEVIH